MGSGPTVPAPRSPPWTCSDEKMRACVCVIANEDVHMLIQGCQLRQVSPARDGASWAVSYPGFGQGSPGQGRAAVRAAVATSAWDLRDLGAQAPWRPHGAPTSLGLGDTRSWCAAEGSLGSRDAGGIGTGTMLPPSPCVFFPSRDLTQNLPQCEVAAAKRTLN